MVVVSHLFFFLRKYFRGRCDSLKSHRPLFWDYLFPDSPFYFFMQEGEHIMEQNQNFVLDDELTISEKCRYGYSYNPMIPLTTKQAKLLYKKGLANNYE